MKQFIFLLLFFNFHILSAKIIYVNLLVSGSDNSGLTWNEAYNSFDLALENAQEGDSIWVSRGVYYPAANEGRYSSFTISTGVAVFGGFKGDENSISQRDLVANSTILSGDIGISNDISDNCFTVVEMNFPNEKNILDGFIIKDGHANSENTADPFNAPPKNGGGIFIESTEESTSAVFKNCQFENNSCNRRGGALYVKSINGASVTLEFQNCIFNNNSGFKGAGIAITGGIDSVVFNETYFEQNTAAPSGGGTFFADVTDSRPTIEFIESDFSNNEGININITINSSVEDFTFAMSDCNITGSNNIFTNIFVYNNQDNTSKGSMKFNECTFENNYYEISSDNKRLFKVDAVQNLTFERCRFEDNNSTLLDTDRSTDTLVIKDSQFHSNISDNEIFRLFSKLSFIDGSLFSNNYGKTLFGFGSYQIEQKNVITNSIFNNNICFEKGILSLRGETSEENLSVLHSSFINNINEQNTGDIIDMYESNDYLIANITNSVFYSDDISRIAFRVKSGAINVENSSFSQQECANLFEVSGDNQGQVNCISSVLFDTNPDFNNIENEDFSLKICSPVIDAGKNTSLNSGDDFLGEFRVKGEKPDMGAIEAETISLDIIDFRNTSCLSNSGYIKLDVKNACEPYTIYKNTIEEISDEINNLDVGLYEFSVEDSNGRKAFVSSEIVIDLAEGDFLLAPNIVSPGQIVTIKNCNKISANLIIYDNAGKKVYTKESEGEEFIFTSPYISGIYYISISSLSENEVFKLIVQN
jgi:predicted outer membrane repeat protein